MSEEELIEVMPLVSGAPGTPSGTTLGFNLPKLFPDVFGVSAAVSPVRNLTGGTMQLTIDFDKENPISGDWESETGVIRDKATPVLVSDGYLTDTSYVGAVFKPGAPKPGATGFDPDTLVITYTERIAHSSLLAATKPLIFKRAGTGNTDEVSPTLTYVSDDWQVGGSGSGWHRVIYTLPENGFGFPGENGFIGQNDSVYINWEAGIADVSGNVQNNPGPGFNKKIPIRIEVPDNLWALVIRNNPFTSRNSARNSTTVVFRSLIRGADDSERIADNTSITLMLYDNMGNLVLKDEYPHKKPGNSNWKSEFSPRGEESVEWTWRGHNKRGRLVGTGTYHMKAVIDTKSSLIPGGSNRTTEVRAIGFVR
jgi:hypothetical protein